MFRAQLMVVLIIGGLSFSRSWPQWKCRPPCKSNEECKCRGQQTMCQCRNGFSSNPCQIPKTTALHSTSKSTSTARRPSTRVPSMSASSTRNSPVSTKTNMATTVKTTNSTSLTMSTISTTQATSVQQTSTQRPTPFFNPEQCNDSTKIGLNCATPSSPCQMLRPCLNNGTCNNTDDGYNCSCLSGFNGTHCQFDHRPCQPHTCLDRGVCNRTSSTTFSCECNDGWSGKNCEVMMHGCASNPCLNKGMCRPSPSNFTCECLRGSYSGRYCEIIVAQIIIYKIVSTSCAYIAIIAMGSVAMFIIIMDILKYGFGIDPVHEERERIRRKKRAKQRRPPVIQRFIYVNAPPSQESVDKATTATETTI